MECEPHRVMCVGGGRWCRNHKIVRVFFLESQFPVRFWYIYLLMYIETKGRSDSQLILYSKNK